MTFNELLIEIILIIFHIHIYVHIRGKKPLLLTCRRWYKIASEDPTLWGTIAFRGWVRGLCYSDVGSTFDDLARDILRTGGTTFTSLFRFPSPAPENADIQRFATRVDRDWLSRCRSLTLRDFDEPPQYSMESSMNDVLRPLSGHFAALEHFSVQEAGTEYQISALETLIQRIAASAVNLQSLKLTRGRGPGAIAVQIFQHAGMLSRVRVMLLEHVNMPVPWREFTHLEHLDFVCFDGSQSNLSELSGPHLTSLCLDVSSSDTINLPTHALFEQLTHLVLRNYAPIVVFRIGFSPSLPRLTHFIWGCKQRSMT